jgi:hypothetical protein
MAELFKDSAETVADVAGMADRVQQQLVELIDQTMSRQFHDETSGGPERFAIGSQHVEIEINGPHLAVAYLSDSKGKRLISHTFRPGTDAAEAVLDALGLDEVNGGDTAVLTEYLRSLAA